MGEKEGEEWVTTSKGGKGKRFYYIYGKLEVARLEMFTNHVIFRLDAGRSTRVA